VAGCSVVAFGLRAFKMDAVVGKNGQAYFSTACWSLEWVSSYKKYRTFWRQVCNSSTCDFCSNQIFSGSSAVRALSDVIMLLRARSDVTVLLSVADSLYIETGKASTRVQARPTPRGECTAISPVLIRILHSSTNTGYNG